METNLLQFVDHLPAAVFRVTVEGRIVYCNQCLCRLFGFDSTSEVKARPAASLYRNPKDRGHLVQGILQMGQVVDVPVAFSRQDGTPIWCAVTAKVVLDDDDSAVFLDGFLKDITEEMKDHVMGRCGSAAAATGHHAVFNLDMQGRFVDCNSQGRQLLGLEASQLGNQSLVDFFPSSDRDLFLLLLADIRKVGRKETVLRLKDGQGMPRMVEATASLVCTDGRPNQVNVIVRDVTERQKRAEAKRDTEKFQGVLEMAGAVAHRLNQPLTVVTNVVNALLLDMGPNHRFYPSMQRAHSQILRLNEITAKIGSIKKYAAIDYVAGVKIVDIDQAS